METSEFNELNGNFEILDYTLEVLEICGQKRAVLRPRAFGGSLKECRLTGISIHSEKGVDLGKLETVFVLSKVSFLSISSVNNIF